MGRKRRRSRSELLVLVSLLLVTLVTFLQAVVDYLQSKTIGAYLPEWQRYLIMLIAVLGFLGLLLAYIANSKSRYSPIP